MASIESNIQGIVHALEHGGLSKWIKATALLGAILAVALVHLFFGFKGMGEAAGMDQAQIARNIAKGQGFTTNYIRPLALWQFQKNGKEIPRVSIPDTYHSPLGPWANAVPLRLIQGKWKMGQQQVVYLGDRVIAATAMVFFVLSVIVTFLTAWRLFDLRVAMLGAGLLLVCDLFWQFSMSGLPHMLMLFFFSCASYTMVRAVLASYASKPVGLWLAAAGVLYGLLALTHALTVWIFAGALLFTLLFFRPRLVSALLVAGFFLLVFTPWLARNYAVSGSPFGIGIYGALDGVQMSETAWMRQNDPPLNTIGPGSFRIQLQKRTLEQFERLFEFLGWSVVAPVFFLALLHTFRRKEASSIRWLLFSSWAFGVTGMILFGVKAGEAGGIGVNQLNVLFIPLMTVYGMAFIIVLWSRLPIDYRAVRIAFFCVLYLLCSIPTIIALVPGAKAKIHWPPYVPPFIAILGDWTQPHEIIASDMPWAVAWYADRRSMLLPGSPAELTRLHDYEVLGGPINGLYLTPVTGNRPFFSDIIKGEYKDWAPFILRTPAGAGFHLQAATALPVDNECIFFSDRDRWSRTGIELPEALQEGEPEETE